jgi:hypothetical protein
MSAAPAGGLLDVDFLWLPRSNVPGVGYQPFCARYDIDADPSLFSEAVLSASSILNEQDHIYDPIFVHYAAHHQNGCTGLARRLRGGIYGMGRLPAFSCMTTSAGARCWYQGIKVG